jgi:hypothetical protein
VGSSADATGGEETRAPEGRGTSAGAVGAATVVAPSTVAALIGGVAGARPITVERVLVTAAGTSPLTGASPVTVALRDGSAGFDTGAPALDGARPVAVRAWTTGAGAVGTSASMRAAVAAGAAGRAGEGALGCRISTRAAPPTAGRTAGRTVAASSGSRALGGGEASRACSGGFVKAVARLQAVCSVAFSSTITDGKRGWCRSERAGLVMVVSRASGRDATGAGGTGVGRDVDSSKNGDSPGVGVSSRG